MSSLLKHSRSQMEQREVDCPVEAFMDLRVMRIILLAAAIALCNAGVGFSVRAETENSIATQIPGHDAIVLGAAWYPEQWPEARWEEDLRLMEAAHLSVVRVAEFAWSTMEPAEGKFELDWLETPHYGAGDANGDASGVAYQQISRHFAHARKWAAGHARQPGAGIGDLGAISDILQDDCRADGVAVWPQRQRGWVAD